MSVAARLVLFTDSFSAKSVEDINIVLRKLARAAASGKQIESEVGRFAITDEETKDPRRKKSYITSGVYLGIGFPLGDSYSGIDHLKRVGWMTRYEAGQWVIENSIGVSWGSGGKIDTLYNSTIYEHEVTIVPWDLGV